MSQYYNVISHLKQDVKSSESLDFTDSLVAQVNSFYIN